MGYETNLQLFIDGVWKSGEGRDSHDVVNPVDAKPVAAVPYATKADLEEALAASERAWPEWRAMDVEKRGAILLDGGAQQVSDISSDANAADTTIKVGWDDWQQLASGQLDGMTAFMMGKLRVEGDMSNAMQLQGVLAKLKS